MAATTTSVRTRRTGWTSRRSTTSRRELIEDPQKPEYGSGANLRRVNCCGYISVYGKRYYLSESFIGKYIELRPQDGSQLVLAYGKFEIARIDLAVEKFISRKIYRL